MSRYYRTLFYIIKMSLEFPSIINFGQKTLYSTLVQKEVFVYLVSTNNNTGYITFLVTVSDLVFLTCLLGTCFGDMCQPSASFHVTRIVRAHHSPFLSLPKYLLLVLCSILNIMTTQISCFGDTLKSLVSWFLQYYYHCYYSSRDIGDILRP
jgi:hypothetical protein